MVGRQAGSALQVPVDLALQVPVDLALQVPVDLALQVPVDLAAAASTGDTLVALISICISL